MIERNKNLITILGDKTNFLIKEKDRRLSFEEAYHNLQPQLKNLKNKIAKIYLFKYALRKSSLRTSSKCFQWIENIHERKSIKDGRDPGWKKF